MAGRAGRKEGQPGRADFVVDMEDEDYVAEDIWTDESIGVKSFLCDVSSIAFHLLPRMADGTVFDLASAEKWFSRSLRAFEGRSGNLAGVFDYLVSKEAVRQSGDGRYVLATVGEVSVSYYFHPANVSCWRDNFRELFELGLEDDDIAVSWALGRVEVDKARGDLGKHRWVTSNYRDALPPGLDPAQSVLTQVMWWYLLGGPPVGQMKALALEMREDAGRVVNALLKLDAAEGWDMGAFFKSLEGRIHRRIPSHLAALCSLGIGKGLAEALYNSGITDVDRLLAERQLGETIDTVVRRLADELS